MREKVDAIDYKYFVDANLPPVKITDAKKQELKESIPILKLDRIMTYQNDFGLDYYDASVIAKNRKLADYFEAVQQTCGDAKLAANWVMGELSSMLNTGNLSIEQSPVSAKQLGGMIVRIIDNTISGKIAKMVFEAMANGEGSADQVIEAKGLKQVTDSGAIESMLDEVLAANAEQVEQYRASDEAKRGKMFGFFVGQAMKASKGKANPGQVNELLKRKLEG